MENEACGANPHYLLTGQPAYLRPKAVAFASEGWPRNNWLSASDLTKPEDRRYRKAPATHSLSEHFFRPYGTLLSGHDQSRH